MPLDSATWLAAVNDDSPTGPNLEFDPDFAALDRAAEGTPERQAGDTIKPAEEPDWKDVEAQALALLERTRDLRVIGHLAVARLHLTGLPDYAEVLAVVRQLLETRWDEVHPQLDPEDDNDPTLRANALLRLGHPGLVLKFVRDVPLAVSPRLGHYSWRDIAVATGLIPTEATDKPSEALIRSAFQDTDPANLSVIRAASLSAANEATAISAVFDERSGYGTGPDYTELVKLLNEVVRAIDRYGVMPAEDALPEAEAGSRLRRGRGADRPRTGRRHDRRRADRGQQPNRCLASARSCLPILSQERAFEPVAPADRAGAPACRNEFPGRPARPGAGRARSGADRGRHAQ